MARVISGRRRGMQVTVKTPTDWMWAALEIAHTEPREVWHVQRYRDSIRKNGAASYTAKVLGRRAGKKESRHVGLDASEPASFFELD